jgi:hypothetical protein
MFRGAAAAGADDICARLRRLPAVFGPVHLYFDIEALEAARRDGTLEVYVLENVQGEQPT